MKLLLKTALECMTDDVVIGRWFKCWGSDDWRYRCVVERGDEIGPDEVAEHFPELLDEEIVDIGITSYSRGKVHREFLSIVLSPVVVAKEKYDLITKFAGHVPLKYFLSKKCRKRGDGE